MTDKCCPPEPENAIPNVQPVEWCSGNKTLRWEKGRITERPRDPLIEDAVYTNATIRTVDGCIVEITEGTNVVYSACDPCAVAASPPVNGTVAISGESCNLTTYDQGGALLTQFFSVSSPCIAVDGCGTSYSPLIPTIIRSPDAGNVIECRDNGLFVPATQSNGVDFNGCGIVISNGLVTGLPLPFQPLLNLTSTDGTVILTRSVDGCAFNLSALGGAGGAVPVVINYDSVGVLPSVAAPGQTFATVGTVNPRDLYVYVTTFGWSQVVGATVNL